MENCNAPTSDIEAIKKSVLKIETALLGDEFHPEGGLVKRMATLEEKQDRVEKKIIIFSSLASGFSFALGFMIKIIKL